jgi:TolB-like protein/class 3 adenylate cyclase
LSDEHLERRLAAILAADVAGSCRLIGIDEEGTLARLKALRRTLFDPKIADHHGRVVKNTGDGALVEFGSVVDAVRCAVEIQRSVAEQNVTLPQDSRIEFRIGIHVGDIIFDNNDIFGDGVNIAARLEGIAEPGGVSISDDAYRQVRGKVEIACDDIGPQCLKNIAEPMRAWRVRLTGQIPSMQSGSAVSQPRALPLPDKPSLAVLPFQNMSGDPEQEYFADGVVEDIITALSRFKSLFVIARNSSFTYRGKAVDVKQVGRELGVRYVLEGSVRKSGKRVRIVGQLIDARTGGHLWADRFDGELEDLFELQDQVATNVISALVPKLEQVEIERVKHKPTESLDAYDSYLRGIATMLPYTREGDNEALRLFYRAIELDPEFAVAYVWAAWIFVTRKSNGWMIDRNREIAETTRLARCAVELGRDDAAALCWGGGALAYVANELDEGITLLDRALVLNPNLAAAWNVSGWLLVYLGAADEAVTRFTTAMRLSPLDPLIFRVHGGVAYAHFFAGRYEEARGWAEKAVRSRPTWLTGVRGAAVCNALAGRLNDARRYMGTMRALDPTLRLSNLQEVLPLRRAADFARWSDAMRVAGLPE